MTIQTRIANRGDNHEAALKALYDFDFISF